MSNSRRQSLSPPRLTDDSRAQSKSPQRLPQFRNQSKSPPTLMTDRAHSKSPPRVKERRPQSKSPPTPTDDWAEFKSPLNMLEEDVAQMTFTRRSRQTDSGDPQSAGSEKTHNSGRTGGKHRRATPTPTACWRGDMAAVKCMLFKGLSDIGGRGGAVMTAAFEGQVELVELLVSEGADVSLMDKYGNNILHYACVGGDVETVTFVLSLNVVDINSRGWRSRTPVMEAAEWRHRNVVELLVSKGADLSLVDGGDNNILHFACIGGDVETVTCVLSLHVVDINSRGRGCRTPVMDAAWRGHRDVVELLVSEGADVSLVDKDGDNTLHFACIGGDVETEKFVLSLNVLDIDARNNNGQRAADVARVVVNKKVVKRL